MKQIIGIGIFLIFSFKLIGQEIINGYKNGRQIIGTKVERNLTGETVWTDRDSSTYVYDEQQRLIKKENLYFNDTIWTPNSRILLEYAADNQSYLHTFQRWYADVFMEDKYQVTEVFNEQNQLVNRVIRDWINDTWLNASKEEYSYDELGNITNITHYQFVNNEWILSWKELFTFDELGNQISSVYRNFNIIEFLVYESGDSLGQDTINGLPVINFWKLVDGDWVLKSRETNFFNNTNILDSTLVQWRFGDTLELFRHIIFNYNTNNQLIQKMSFDIKDNQRKPLFVYNYTYDNNGYLILEDPLIWSQEAGAFTEYEAGQREWVYADNGSLLKEVDYTGWAIEYAPWIAYDRNITYYANSLTVSVNRSPNNFSVQLFPNPTHQFLTIKLVGDISYPLQMAIINLQGQILKQRSLDTNLAMIELIDLPKGIYFVQLRNKFGTIKTKKFMKQ